MQVKNIGLDKAMQKIRHYCAYQERNHRETKEKLYSYGLYRSEVEQALSQLIEENYLNEERFAIAYAGGKFRINHWGKVKIRYALQQKQVSAYCIKQALAAIEPQVYQETLQKKVNEKYLELGKKHTGRSLTQKLQTYFIQKGFEHTLISGCIKNISETEGS